MTRIDQALSKGFSKAAKQKNQNRARANDKRGYITDRQEGKKKEKNSKGEKEMKKKGVKKPWTNAE